MAARISKGFTLVESIFVIIILGLAMITLVSVLYPQIAQSAKPYYEVRASALANSLMTEILARNFDEHSDHDGGKYRCGELGPDSMTTISCTDDSALGREEPVALFNDVDDYIGCWYTSSDSRQRCTHPADKQYPLSDIFGNTISDDYQGFKAEVSINYDYDCDLLVKADACTTKLFKKITVVITASQYGDFTFVAHKGNF
ncbi:type IV pilus modification PilV family protein [Vibrio gallicus]|uniref:type IV pilus modification PilV family protein n=1 Tax=Vibrio gallicus TaxID=190897 RepID=UPI0021C3918B|nr:type II secretion system protein [Vibrio gallicus]